MQELGKEWAVGSSWKLTLWNRLRHSPRWSLAGLEPSVTYGYCSHGRGKFAAAMALVHQRLGCRRRLAQARRLVAGSGRSCTQVEKAQLPGDGQPGNQIRPRPPRHQVTRRWLRSGCIMSTLRVSFELKSCKSIDRPSINISRRVQVPGRQADGRVGAKLTSPRAWTSRVSRHWRLAAERQVLKWTKLPERCPISSHHHSQTAHTAQRDADVASHDLAATASGKQRSRE